MVVLGNLEADSSTAMALFNHRLVLKMHLKRSQEDLVETFPVPCTALKESLEVVLLCPLPQLHRCYDLLHFDRISFQLNFVSQITLRANQNARAILGCGLDFGDPGSASLFEGISVDETEADDEAVSVSVRYRS